MAHEHPDAPGRAKGAGRKASPKNALGQNKLEARFDAHLTGLKWAGRISDFRFEPFKLRLAGRTFYSPDFAVRRNDGSIAICECKGFLRDDAAVKTKTAAEQFAWLGWSFWLVRKDKACAAGWDVRPVTRSGFGLTPSRESWLEIREAVG